MKADFLRFSQSDAGHGQEGGASPSTDQSLTHSLRGLMLNKPAQPGLLHSQQSAFASLTDNQYAPMTLQGQQPWTMWPLVCQTHYPPSSGYPTDGSPGSTTDMRVPNGNYRLVASTMPHQGPMSPVTERYNHPRSVPLFNRPDSRRQNASRVSRSSFHNAASHHNQVDIARIREGTDVRTTASYLNCPTVSCSFLLTKQRSCYAIFLIKLTKPC